MSVQSLLLYKIATIHRKAGAQVIKLCEDSYAITRREFRILSLLGQKGRLQSSDIATSSELERTRASRVLVALHQKKIIQRVHAPNDHRVVLYELTETGQSIYQALMPQIAEINRTILGTLDTQEAQDLIKSLDKIIQSIHSKE